MLPTRVYSCNSLTSPPRLSLAALQSSNRFVSWSLDEGWWWLFNSDESWNQWPVSLSSSTLTEYSTEGNYCISRKQLQHSRLQNSAGPQSSKAKKASLQGRQPCSVPRSHPSNPEGTDENGFEEKEKRETASSKRDLRQHIVNCVALMDKPVNDTIELLPSLPRPTLHQPLVLLYEIPGQIRSSLI